MEEIQQVKFFCDKYGIRPSKKRGQNFLVDANIMRMMLEYANLGANDYIVEVGPGLGVLTRELVEKVKQVVAVEVDEKMVQALKELFPLLSNGSSVAQQRKQGLSILNSDILEISNQELVEMLHNPLQLPLTLRGRERSAPPLKVRGGQGGVMNISYKVVANLPYSITSAVLRKFTEEEPRPELIVVMVQKEVAERVCAQPGEMSILSVAVQYYGKPEIIKIVPRNAFWPIPDVDSAILKIEARGGSTSAATEVEPRDFEKRLFQLVKMGFSSRRKQLQNNLMAGLRIPREQAVKALENVGLESKVRAQELSVSKWAELVGVLS